MTMNVALPQDLGVLPNNAVSFNAHNTVLSYPPSSYDIATEGMDGICCEQSIGDVMYNEDEDYDEQIDPDFECDDADVEFDDEYDAIEEALVDSDSDNDRPVDLEQLKAMEQELLNIVKRASVGTFSKLSTTVLVYIKAMIMAEITNLTTYYHVSLSAVDTNNMDTANDIHCHLHSPTLESVLKALCALNTSAVHLGECVEILKQSAFDYGSDAVKQLHDSHLQPAHAALEKSIGLFRCHVCWDMFCEDGSASYIM